MAKTVLQEVKERMQEMQDSKAAQLATIQQKQDEARSQIEAAALAMKQATEEMIRSGECSRENKGSDIMRGVLMTVAHEFRHLQQNNPYSDKSDMQPDIERDAEDFAIEHYENYERAKYFRNR